ncbi:MAG: GTP 3',8-cyclase MoaA [Rhodocyclaceae bacterium]
MLITPRATRTAGAVLDRLGRPLRDLRISVTDRCNFRCTYCMPKEKFGREHAFLPRQALLSFEEITRVARIAAAQGVRKIRLTGGEPLLRKSLPTLIGMLAAIEGVEVALTTNGALLVRQARALRDAGLARLTVSLDALDDVTFRRMNDVDFPVASVLEGIAAAEAAGFASIKINMVVQRGVNDKDIVPMARRFHGTDHVLRFIEYMDVGQTNGWRMNEVLAANDILRLIDAEFPLEALAPAYRGEVAERWRYRDGGGQIGIIAAVTQAFCQDCTRLRLSPEGKLFTCLFAGSGHDLRARLRGGASDTALADWMAGVWSGRTDRYSELRGQDTGAAEKIEMSYIGG